MARKPRIPGDESGRNMRAARAFRACLPLLIVLWVFLVLYPNPLRLVVSLQRLANPRVDPAAVETLAAGLPSDPLQLRRRS